MKLRAVNNENPHPRDLAHKAVKRHRAQARVNDAGLLIGERFNHRGWPPEITLAFLYAEVIRPEKGALQKRLYEHVPGDQSKKGTQR